MTSIPFYVPRSFMFFWVATKIFSFFLVSIAVRSNLDSFSIILRFSSLNISLGWSMIIEPLQKYLGEMEQTRCAVIHNSCWNVASIYTLTFVRTNTSILKPGMVQKLILKDYCFACYCFVYQCLSKIFI